MSSDQLIIFRPFNTRSKVTFARNINEFDISETGKPRWLESFEGLRYSMAQIIAEMRNRGPYEMSKIILNLDKFHTIVKRGIIGIAWNDGVEELVEPDRMNFGRLMLAGVTTFDLLSAALAIQMIFQQNPTLLNHVSYRTVNMINFVIKQILFFMVDFSRPGYGLDDDEVTIYEEALMMSDEEGNINFRYKMIKMFYQLRRGRMEIGFETAIINVDILYMIVSKLDTVHDSVTKNIYLFHDLPKFMMLVYLRKFWKKKYSDMWFKENRRVNSRCKTQVLLTIWMLLKDFRVYQYEMARSRKDVIRKLIRSLDNYLETRRRPWLRPFVRFLRYLLTVDANEALIPYKDTSENILDPALHYVHDEIHQARKDFGSNPPDDEHNDWLHMMFDLDRYRSMKTLSRRLGFKQAREMQIKLNNNYNFSSKIQELCNSIVFVME